MASPGRASAGGYDQATWGMTLAQVEKAYPGGTRNTSPDGVVYYFVLRKFARLDAVAGFSFDGDRLAYVALRFPRPGRPVDMKRIRYASPTNEEAREFAAAVRGALESKYGVPSFDSERQGIRPAAPTLKAAWRTSDGDTLVTLEVIPEADGLRSDVGVSYGRWEP